MAKIKQSIESTIVDENGVIKEQRTNRIVDHGNGPAYVMLYIADILYLSDMPKQYMAVTLALLKRVRYAGDEDGLCVILVPKTKRDICKELGWETVQSLDNALIKLVKGKILERIDRGYYRFNPYLFGKGDWQDIDSIRLEVVYDIKGKTFQAVLEQAEQSDKAAETTEPTTTPTTPKAPKTANKKHKTTGQNKNKTTTSKRQETANRNCKTDTTLPDI